MRLVLLSLLVSALSSHAAVDFSHQIVPILREHSAECHAGDKKKGGLSFNDQESLMEGGENGPQWLGQSCPSTSAFFTGRIARATLPHLGTGALSMLAMIVG